MSRTPTFLHLYRKIVEKDSLLGDKITWVEHVRQPKVKRVCPTTAKPNLEHRNTQQRMNNMTHVHNNQTQHFNSLQALKLAASARQRTHPSTKTRTRWLILDKNLQRHRRTRETKRSTQEQEVRDPEKDLRPEQDHQPWHQALLQEQEPEGLYCQDEHLHRRHRVKDNPIAGKDSKEVNDDEE